MSPICTIGFPDAEDTPSSGVDSSKWARDIISARSNSGLEDAETTHHSPCLPNLTVTINHGDAQLLVSPQDSTPYDLSDLDSQYPTRFRIPPATLFDLPRKEYTTRAQEFAIGSLLYTTMAGRLPFADLDDSLVQQNFEKGIYPSEVMEFPLEIAIAVLGSWSQEFAQQITEHSRQKVPSADQTGVLGKVFAHMKTHPISSGLTVAGSLVLGVTSIINPALGIIGFSAMGPVAGSAAAAWQSSIGLVQAGSFFAWCQSLAMGGSAAGAILGAQGVAASAAGLGLLGMRGGDTNEEAARRMIWSLFLANVRKEGGEDTDKKEVNTTVN